jgi:LacI family transcriptional regulator
MATIKDIAREAGVSYTTVSNVIHGRADHVSPQTITAINEIIKRSGYVPNMSARSLVSNFSKVVGYINHMMPGTDGRFVADPFHSAFIGSVEEVLRENGYYLMLRTVSDSEELLKFLHNWNLDGLFFTGLFEDSFFDTLKEINVPIVLIDSYIKHYTIQNVGLEDYRGGYIATKYLLENGHRNIVFASPQIRVGGVVDERLCGYRQALSEFGVPFREDYICVQEFDISSGISLGKQIAAKEGVTAIFATADILAAGIMAGLHACGKRIPEDISIIGFDDIDICRLITPPLTTIHQNPAEKGRVAVEFMLKRLQNEPIEKNEIILPVSLVERSSVKNIG